MSRGWREELTIVWRIDADDLVPPITATPSISMKVANANAAQWSAP